MEGSPHWLTHPEGRVRIDELGDGRRRLTVEDPTTFISTPRWETAYPVDLIEQILEVKGSSYLCDEIKREEDPDYVQLFLRYSLLGFIPEEDFAGARILDFGSGSGASTAILSRMFPNSELVGVELLPEFIAISNARAHHYGLTNIRNLVSPDPEQLPEGIGEFDFVNLGAVYEHLLPDERRRLIPQLWSVLKTGGVLFVNQLPHRWYFVEQHTTSLPLLNYLPDLAAHKVARRFSSRIDSDASWAELLRAGIRGGTEREVLSDVRAGGGDPDLLRPDRLGLKDHAGLWYAYSAGRRPHPVKRAMRFVFRVMSALTRSSFAPGLSMAIRKRA